jgi:nucleoside-diphosphate-sugar epimerase
MKAADSAWRVLTLRSAAGCTRVGDIKHSLADIGAAREGIGYCPEVHFEEGKLAIVPKCTLSRGRGER